MVQILVISLIFCVITVAGSTPTDVTSELLVEIVSNNSTIQKGHPEVEIVPFDGATKDVGILKHTFGQKTNRDRLIAKGNSTNTYPTPQDIQVSFTYPISGNEEPQRVTYVEIIVFQTSNLGKAYILEGGIGQKYIKIAVEAYSSTKLEYTATLYSSAARIQSQDLLIPLVLLFCFSRLILKI